jgi:hypothetical protein
LRLEIFAGGTERVFEESEDAFAVALGADDGEILRKAVEVRLVGGECRER